MAREDLTVKISSVKTEQDLQTAISLFKAYAASLGIDLSFQDFATEMASMPGKYAPPSGNLFIARISATEEVVGCVGLRPLSSGVCEMKRLYVNSEGRGLGAGRALAERVIAEAKRLGYGELVLDSLPTMVQARRLYESLGFVETEAYYETPMEETAFFRLGLRAGDD